MRSIFIIVIKCSVSAISLAGIMFIAGCNKLDEPDPEPTETLYELLSSTQYLDSIKKYVDLYPGLVTILESPGANTFFAPDNASFISLLETPGFPADMVDINPEILEWVLLYHVVPEKAYMSGGLGTAMSTLITELDASDVIKVNSDGTLLTGSTNQNILIVQADIIATNGVMHVTGNVLLPPSLGLQFGCFYGISPFGPTAKSLCLPGKIGGTVMLGADFTSLASLVTKADSEVPAGELPVLGYMISAPETPVADAQFTLFAVPNPVFDEAATEAGVSLETLLANFSPDSARTMILNHMIEGAISSATLGEGGKYVTLAGNEIVSGTDPVSGDIVINQSIPLVEGSTDWLQSNGTLHVIGGIIR